MLQCCRVERLTTGANWTADTTLKALQLKILAFTETENNLPTTTNNDTNTFDEQKQL
jgi:hypothetical protein